MEKKCGSCHTFGVRRLAAALVCFSMLVLLLFSVFCIAARSDHVCTQEDCPICACVQRCKDTLRQVGTDAAIPAAPVLLAAVFLPLPLSVPREAPHATLITQKLRMNN